MIRINPIELSVHYSKEDLERKILSVLKISPKELIRYEIVRRSLDARKKEDIRYSFMIEAAVSDEKKILKRCKNKCAAPFVPHPYVIPPSGTIPLIHRPVIIGTGPAGLFCGLILARAGYNPVLLERGEDADTREKTVRTFWETGILNPESNVSFGEGGAGTFSDGKLNTLIKDAEGKNREVLKTFVDFGADPEILYEQKPHIGTDQLIKIVTNIRKEIIRLGGSVRFHCRADALILKNDQIAGISCIGPKGKEEISCSVLIAATGHSARDTFYTFRDQGILMASKSFAVGLRVQHSQRSIDLSQFGEKEASFLSPASYKLTAKSCTGRGVYTFCMCPGGYVVNASTEEGLLAVNGMSYHKRNGRNANSAVIMTVDPSDFPSTDPLAGLEFQRQLERAACREGNGKIPVQLYEDFKNKKASVSWGNIEPCFKGETSFADLNRVLPGELCTAFSEGMESFGRKIKGFADPDVILAGVESRTSSPIRIFRDDAFQGNIHGFFPCGEGAGYAGGITSAAIDGMRVAEAVIRSYRFG